MKESELLDPVPPGKILYEEFMKPLGLSANQLARDIDVPTGRISEVMIKISLTDSQIYHCHLMMVELYGTSVFLNRREVFLCNPCL